MSDRKEHPILFNAEMVRAILAGDKTQTRRVIPYQPGPEYPFSSFVVESTNPKHEGAFVWTDRRDHLGRIGRVARCPYGQAGHRLWVRETWCASSAYDGIKPRDIHPGAGIAYPADGHDDASAGCLGLKKRPSIHMPRWASRIDPGVLGVRVERVQDITEEDAKAEGVDHCPAAPAALSHRTAFRGLWDSINAKRGFGWDSNPWVFAVEFERVKGGEHA